MSTKKTRSIGVRLPVEVIEEIERSSGATVSEMIRQRITYDVLSKHGKLTRKQVQEKYPHIKAIYVDKPVLNYPA